MGLTCNTPTTDLVAALISEPYMLLLLLDTDRTRLYDVSRIKVTKHI